MCHFDALCNEEVKFSDILLNYTVSRNGPTFKLFELCQIFTDF